MPVLYTPSVSGTTTSEYADALDLDTRGTKGMTAVVKNTDGANSLDYKVLARYANYSSGADEELQAEKVLAHGEKGLIELSKAYARIKIQVKDTVGGDHAAYTIDFLINR